MKFRKDFVTNSSSSSYICEICGAVASGWDISLQEAEMVECENGHVVCLSETLTPDMDVLKKMMVDEYEKDMAELDGLSDDEVVDIFMDLDDAIYMVPEMFCPICQFIEYSDRDLAKYLEKQYGVSRDEVFAKVKETNKRRKKLYENEYITEVCQRFSLSPSEIVSGLKEEFGTYRKFADYIRG